MCWPACLSFDSSSSTSFISLSSSSESMELSPVLAGIYCCTANLKMSEKGRKKENAQSNFVEYVYQHRIKAGKARIFHQRQLLGQTVRSGIISGDNSIIPRYSRSNDNAQLIRVITDSSDRNYKWILIVCSFPSAPSQSIELHQCLLFLIILLQSKQNTDICATCWTSVW